MSLQTGVSVFAENNTDIATETPSVIEVAPEVETEEIGEELTEESLEEAMDTESDAETVSEYNIIPMAYEGVSTIASDETTNWAMQWSWERYEAGWDYYADWTLTNGFEITYNKAKYDELVAVRYKRKKYCV